MADRIKERNTLALKNLGFGVKNEIDLAYSAGNGYFREFNVPENLNGIPYNISSVAGMIYLATEKDSMGINIPEIDGSIQKGRNFIRKENNIIYLN
jgi:hypothetical protein